MRAGRVTLGCTVVALMAGCATATSASDGSDVRPSQPGMASDAAADVIRVGGFAHVQALAVSRSRVYVIADGGVAMFDRLAQRWQIPVPLTIASSRSALRAFAVADPATDVLFVASGARMWIVRPATRFVSNVPLPAEARQLALERNGRGAFVFANGWWLVSSSGSTTPLPPGQSPQSQDILPTPDPQQILRETPGLESFGGLLTRDQQLRTWPLTALARAPERSDVWAGTDGGGVFEVDPTFLRSEQRPYGLHSGGASAVALAADGAWFAEEPLALRVQEFSLTFVSADLATWRWLSPIRGTLGVASMVLRGHVVCLATNAGAFIIDLAARVGEPRRYELQQVGRQLAAWSTPDGCWIGGTTGIARLAWPGDTLRQPEIIAQGHAAFAFASSGDTVWAATQTGVRRYIGGRPTAPDGSPGGQGALPNALSFPIRSLALTEAGLAILTDRELWLTSGSGRMTEADRVAVSLDRVGRTRRIAADDRTLWLAGSRGVLVLSTLDHHSRFIDLVDPFAPPDHGGFEDVADIALSPEVAWLATRGGIVRVARGADGLPR